jgi:glycosyltransferase involved in cell wall biosynthesis
MKSVGLVDDLAGFYAACDVFIAPSEFDPGPLVAFEAAARGVPVIATEGCGFLHHLLEYQAGLEWRPAEPLADLVRHAAKRRDAFNAGAAAMAEALSEDRQTRALLDTYEQALSRKGLKDQIVA